MAKFSQIIPNDVLRAQQGDKVALEQVLEQSYPLIYQLLSAQKSTLRIKNIEALHQLVSDIRNYIEDQVIPSYSSDSGEFKDFLWNSVKEFLTSSVEEPKKQINRILTEDVIAAQQGDTKAMDKVIRDLDPLIKGVLTKYPSHAWWIDSEEDLEDLFQHLRAHVVSTGIPKFEPTRGVEASTYLYQIIKNEIILEGQKVDRERKRTSGPLMSLEAPLSEETETSLADVVPTGTDPALQFLPQLYEAARDQMSDFDRKILDARFQGYKFQEIAINFNQQGITTPTGKEIGVVWLNSYYNAKIKPILEQYIWGTLPEQKLPMEELPESSEFLSDEASKLSLHKTANIDIITFLRLYLFE